MSFLIGRGKKTRVRAGSLAPLNALVKGPVFGTGGIAAWRQGAVLLHPGPRLKYIVPRLRGCARRVLVGLRSWLPAPHWKIDIRRIGCIP